MMGHSRHKGLFVGPFRLRMRLALDAVNKHDFSTATREHEVSGCVDKISWDATRDVFAEGVRISATHASELPHKRNHTEQTSCLRRMDGLGIWKGVFRLFVALLKQEDWQYLGPVHI